MLCDFLPYLLFSSSAVDTVLSLSCAAVGTGARILRIPRNCRSCMQKVHPDIRLATPLLPDLHPKSVYLGVAEQIFERPPRGQKQDRRFGSSVAGFFDQLGRKRDVFQHVYLLIVLKSFSRLLPTYQKH